jgi:uncharacterized cupin superfamily protein
VALTGVESLETWTASPPRRDAERLVDPLPAEDEVYVILAGRATFQADTGSAPVGPGDVVYVPTGEAHRFVDIDETLQMLVLFAPAYLSRGVDTFGFSDTATVSRSRRGGPS